MPAHRNPSSRISVRSQTITVYEAREDRSLVLDLREAVTGVPDGCPNASAPAGQRQVNVPSGVVPVTLRAPPTDTSPKSTDGCSVDTARACGS
jgi:hypothetical protein